MCAYVAPSAQSTGDLITSGIWNQNVVDNVVQHQADLDLIYRRPVLPVIINGGFQVWQRGTSFAAIADGAYSADRWRYSKSGAMVNTLSRSTSVPTVGQAGNLASYSLLTSLTTADSSIAAGDYQIVEQRIEGYNFLPIAQRAFTLTFWTRSNITGTYCVAFRNSGNDRSYIAEYTISQADTWEFKTINVTASPSAGTWDYTTGVGLSVAFTMTCGSTYQTTANAWQTGNYLGTSSQTNLNNSTSNTHRLWGVEIHPTDAATGISAADYGYFRPMPYADELLRCGRYYQRFAEESTNLFLGTGINENATESFIGFKLRAPMRAVPTLASSSTNVNVYRGENTASTNTSTNGVLTIFSSYSGTDLVLLEITSQTSVSASVGMACYAYLTGTGEYVEFIAEL